MDHIYFRFEGSDDAVGVLAAGRRRFELVDSLKIFDEPIEEIFQTEDAAVVIRNLGGVYVESYQGFHPGSIGTAIEDIEIDIFRERFSFLTAKEDEVIYESNFSWASQPDETLSIRALDIEARTFDSLFSVQVSDVFGSSVEGRFLANEARYTADNDLLVTFEAQGSADGGRFRNQNDLGIYDRASSDFSLLDHRFDPDFSPTVFQIGSSLAVIGRIENRNFDGLFLFDDATNELTQRRAVEKIRIDTESNVVLGDDFALLNDRKGRTWSVDENGKRKLFFKDDVVVSETIGSADGKTFFTAWTNEFGEEIYSTDGTRKGTHFLGDLTPGTNPSTGLPRGTEVAEAETFGKAALLFADDMLIKTSNNGARIAWTREVDATFGGDLHVQGRRAFFLEFEEETRDSGQLAPTRTDGQVMQVNARGKIKELFELPGEGAIRHHEFFENGNRTGLLVTREDEAFIFANIRKPNRYETVEDVRFAEVVPDLETLRFETDADLLA